MKLLNVVCNKCDHATVIEAGRKFRCDHVLEVKNGRSHRYRECGNRTYTKLPASTNSARYNLAKERPDPELPRNCRCRTKNHSSVCDAEYTFRLYDYRRRHGIYTR